MTDYKVTAIQPEDVKAVIAMHAQSWLDTYPNEAAGVSRQWVEQRVSQWATPENVQMRQDHLKAIANDADSLSKIVRDEDGIVLGVVRASRTEGKQRLGALYVDKRYHGKGIAQLLMKEFLAWEDTSQPTDLEVAAYNDRAKAFYRKYGFEEVEHSEHLFAEKLPVVTMMRKGDDR
jgi:ribosomal protein S18 acetylase RimI-like enzyme